MLSGIKMWSTLITRIVHAHEVRAMGGADMLIADQKDETIKSKNATQQVKRRRGRQSKGKEDQSYQLKR